MSRDYRDQRGGHPTKYYISDKGHTEFARHCRRSARAKACLLYTSPSPRD